MRNLLLVLLSCCGLAVISSCVQQPSVQQSKEHPTEITNSIGMKLALISNGTFARENSPVTLSRDYYLGVYEVTQEQYEKVMDKNPSHFQGDHVSERDPETGVVKEIDSSNHPVEMVSWDDAVEFCKRLSELPEEKAAVRVYRLPTEAEWEYACRAGSQTAYGFGDDEEQLNDYAWFSGNSGETTHRVGQKKPNAWGLYDMYGNVWEWCADRYDDYSKEAVTDPVGTAGSVRRVLRGGCFFLGAAYCRSAGRGRGSPTLRVVNNGFRLALSSPGIPQSEEPDE